MNSFRYQTKSKQGKLDFVPLRINRGKFTPEKVQSHFYSTD